MKNKFHYIRALIIPLLFVFIIMVSCQQQHKSEQTDVSSIQPSAETGKLLLTDAEIAYQIYGEGEPLILCMGYSANMDLWEPKLINSLSKKFKVIVFDYRGMGHSTNSSFDFTIHTLAEDLNELCTHLNLEKVNVLGWSMGGYVAQEFAIGFPEKVNKLILYATDAGGKSVIDPDDEVMKILSDTTSTVQQMTDILFPDNWSANHPESKKYFEHVHEPINRLTVKLQDNAVNDWLSERGGSYGSLYLLKTPTLIISGDVDKVVAIENSEILFDSIANSTLIKVKNGGHGLMFQYPDVFTAFVNAFLDL
ncbi:MAG: alpha/beta hydrolase [Weeksellaceae bacterium]|nr:alpha/beta hydrolase [Weeksellaceae bacterium]